MLLWSIYALIHFAETWPRWQAHPPGGVLAAVAIVLALAVLFRPASSSRFLALLLAWTVAELRFAPFWPNHVLFTLFVHGSILTAVAWQRLRTGRGQVATAFAEWLPVVRLELLLLYGFAFLHKLNRDYLDPSVSCAPILYRQLAEVTGLPLLVGGEELLIAASLAFEVAIPLLLLFRRTLYAGIFAALFFHLLLGLHPRWLLDGFASMVFALLALFVSEGAARTALERLTRLVRSPDAWRARWTAALGLLALAAGGAILAGPELPLRDRAVQGAWLAWSGIVVAGFLCCWRRERASAGSWAGGYPRARREAPGSGTRLFRLRAGPAVAWVALFVLNGLAPYLGLKTESSFSMFANLRTEGGQSNHLWLATWDLFGLQSDIAWLKASSDPGLAALAAGGWGLPYFELRRRLRVLGRDDFVDYRRGGREVHAQGQGRRRRLGAPERLLWFRPVAPLAAPVACTH